MSTVGINWIRFLRQHGPLSRNDSMYDEQTHRIAQRLGVTPLSFEHPLERRLLAAFSADARCPTSVVLTGTAGDGKTNLCRKVWTHVGGDPAAWHPDEQYYIKPIRVGGRDVTLHLISDLTALPEQDELGRYDTKATLLQRLSPATFDTASADVFLIAANDGQLLEQWTRAGNNEHTRAARDLFERLLVEDLPDTPGVPLLFFNLSRQPCAQLLDLALDALLAHPAWQACYDAAEQEGLFSHSCPIRRNYELLKDALVRSRLRSLFELCDHSDLHTPIRRIILLLSNALLGHPDVKDRLMQAGDVRALVSAGTTAKASLFTNVFGGNLTDTRRESLEIFEFLNRFRIGYETSNKIDNILIFGAADDSLRPLYDRLLVSDPFYGADESYRAAQAAYIESAEEDENSAAVFLASLVAQRRRLFFTVPDELVDQLRLWDLTIFQYAGEYLDRVLYPLRQGAPVERAILSRLVRGLNRVFTGLLANTDRDLLLATSLSYSGARVSQILEDRISVTPRLQERVALVLDNDRPTLAVHLATDVKRALGLNLTRYEFLSRVAEGALPGSFSRECYEDILAFKSQVLGALAERRQAEPAQGPQPLYLRLLDLDPSGNVVEQPVEVLNG